MLTETKLGKGSASRAKTALLRVGFALGATFGILVSSVATNELQQNAYKEGYSDGNLGLSRQLSYSPETFYLYMVNTAGGIITGISFAGSFSALERRRENQVRISLPSHVKRKKKKR
jgi:hypothetical protein